MKAFLLQSFHGNDQTHRVVWGGAVIHIDNRRTCHHQEIQRDPQHLIHFEKYKLLQSFDLNAFESPHSAFSWFESF